MIVYFHGLKGSPLGLKAQVIKEHYPEVQIPALPESVTQRSEIIGNLIREPAFLIGSSLGGLSALLFAMQLPHLVKAMFLMAPAVGLYDKSLISEADQALLNQLYIPKEIKTTILVANQDLVIPKESVKELIVKSDSAIVDYHETDDEHGLNHSHALMLSLIREMVD